MDRMLAGLALQIKRAKGSNGEILKKLLDEKPSRNELYGHAMKTLEFLKQAEDFIDAMMDEINTYKSMNGIDNKLAEIKDALEESSKLLAEIDKTQRKSHDNILGAFGRLLGLINPIITDTRDIVCVIQERLDGAEKNVAFARSIMKERRENMYNIDNKQLIADYRACNYMVSKELIEKYAPTGINKHGIINRLKKLGVYLTKADKEKGGNGKI